MKHFPFALNKMAEPIRWQLIALFIFLNNISGMAQTPEPVTWNFTADRVNGNETMLSLKAVIAPGWHLYSQHIKEGGPIPTKFIFEPGDHYMLAGGTVEKGNEIKFYDETYEMQIIWYTGGVVFSQRIRPDQPGSTINGRVEYMACNDEICIPAEHSFTIATP